MSKIRSEFPQTPLNLTLREEQISIILCALENSVKYADSDYMKKLTKSLKSWRLLLTSFTIRLKRQEQNNQRRSGNGTTQTCIR